LDIPQSADLSDQDERSSRAEQRCEITEHVDTKGMDVIDTRMPGEEVIRTGGGQKIDLSAGKVVAQGVQSGHGEDEITDAGYLHDEQTRRTSRRQLR